MSVVYPDRPVWCPACGQAMSWHPTDFPGTRLRWRCQNCQQTWTLKEVLEGPAPAPAQDPKETP